MSSKASQLVVSSFRQSAERIATAMGGLPAFSMSSSPGMPEIVGLCGQGGRHPYFRIPLSGLATAIYAIYGLPADCDDIDAIIAISKRLRAATVFDDHTGCVNDQAPAIVPWLPPEEITFNGQTVPTDVWRLLFAEQDLMLGSLALADDFADVTVMGLSHAALAFADLMRRIQNRHVTFEVTEQNMPSVFNRKVAHKSYRVPIRRLFLEAGMLLTPLPGSGTAPWSVAARYADWIDGAQSELRILNSLKADSIDSRFRGLFAEELAIGMMAIVLHDLLHCHLVSNTVEVLGKRPDGALADFIAKGSFNGSPFSLIAESKGSLSSVVPPARRAKAKLQVGNTNLPGPKGTEYRMTFCSTIRHTSQRSKSVCEVSDPPPDLDLPEQTREPNDVDRWRAAYARAFRFIGLDAAASQALRGVPVTALPDSAESSSALSEGRDYTYSSRVRRLLADQLYAYPVLGFGDGYVVLDQAILQRLQRGITPNSVPDIEATVIEQGFARRARMLQDQANGTESSDSFVGSLGIGLASNSDWARG